jgi:ribose transport system permease protein
MNNPTELHPRASSGRKGVRAINSGEMLGAFFSTYGTLLIILVLGIVFGLTAPRFLLLQNIVNIFKQISVVAIISIGMLMVVLLGGIDLSVGSSALLSGVVTMFLINHGYLPTGWAILAGLLSACLVGLVNGLMIEVVHISSIIVTLGTMIAFRGLAQTILWIDNAWLWVKDPALTFLVQKTVGFIPVLVIFMLILYAIFVVILQHTSFGRYLYAIGGNQRAATLSGLPVMRTKILAYVLCGLTGGIGGLVLVARLAAVSPQVGNNIQFDVITAVVLGGASLSGGSGRLEKTLLGAVIAGMILNYLTIKGIPGEYQSAVNGIIILIAVILDRLSKLRA